MEFVGLSSVNDLKSIKRNGETVRCRHENYTWWLWFMMVSLSLLVYKKKLLGNSRMGIFGKPWNMALSDGLYHQNHHWKMGRMSIIRSTWGAKFSINHWVLDIVHGSADMTRLRQVGTWRADLCPLMQVFLIGGLFIDTYYCTWYFCDFLVSIYSISQ